MLNEREIKVTTNYGMFKRLEGNRDISKQRRDAILSSLYENGYIGAPILVNEKMEVIDGQGRLEACKELGIPIPYCIRRGTDIHTCMVLNQNTRNWNDEDYIRSYAEQGNENYKRLLRLMEKYGEKTTNVIYAVKGANYNGGSNTPLRRGVFKVTDQEFKKGDQTLAKLAPLRPYISESGAPNQKLSCAIMYAINNPNVDYNRLALVMKERHRLIAPLNRMEDLLEEISKIYNTNLKGGIKRIYLKPYYQNEKYEQ